MINISYGHGNSMNVDVNGFRTIQDILNDSNIMAVLGATRDAVEAHVNGALARADSRLSDGDDIRFVSKANGKA